MKFKRITAAVLAFLMLLIFAACNNNSGDKEPEETVSTTSYIREVKTKIGAVNGPLSYGVLRIANDRDYAYSVEFYSNTEEIFSLISSGKLDIAVVPVTTAAEIYNQTNGSVKILAVNSLGTLSVLESGNSIENISDLKGKTVYASGKGTVTEYIINYVLGSNGIDPEKDINLKFCADAAEVAALAEKGEADICFLPEPLSANTVFKNKKLRYALSFTDEWAKTAKTPLTQGIVIATEDFIGGNPEYVAQFLEHNELSVNFIGLESNLVKASGYLFKSGFFTDNQIALNAVPNCNVTYIDGEEMKAAVSNVFEILYQADPSCIGGAIPDDGIYYIP